MSGFISLLYLFPLLLVPYFASSHPLCTNSKGPITVETPLEFCSYKGTACCDAAEDLKLQKEFQALNVSDPLCASLLKLTLCARCDKFSAHLFKIESGRRNVPVLCNSTAKVKLHQSKGSASVDFCTKVYENCGNISIWNSPFAPEINSSPSTLTRPYKSRKGFCESFGGDGGICYSGEPVSLNNAEAPQLAGGLCLEKIGYGSHVDMIPHPDGSNRAFLYNLQGKIWLATLPVGGSNQSLLIDESKPFLDLSDQVVFNTMFGLTGVAFHPDFVHNGRLFASFNCDQTKQAGCSGRCACNTDVNCDPSKLGDDTCRYHIAVAEFTVNGTSPKPSSAKVANPAQARRILTMGLPYGGNHAGQIIFGPADGFLYIMVGDVSHDGDSYQFAQNKKSLLGKILRIDVDDTPSETEINNLGLWGNYTIPKDNPYTEDNELAPEIWASGFRNIWRCNFDSERPSYFMCADSGKEQYEEVDIVVSGGNYGWPVFEGPFLFSPQSSYLANSSAATSSNFILPVMGYRHSELGKNAISAAITGGSFYRSMTDPCMYGRYLFTDLYAGAIWAGTESPANSGNFTTTRIPFKCAHDSPIQCNSTSGGGNDPSLGYVFTFAEDANKDLYLLSSNGLYKVSQPSRCSYLCSKERVSISVPPVLGSSLRPEPIGFTVIFFCLVTCNLVLILLK